MPFTKRPAASKPSARDSYQALLESLEQDRRTVLSEKEYRETRAWVLHELGRGPRVEWSHLLTLGVVGILCAAFVVAGLIAFLKKLVPDLTLVLAGACALLVWTFVLRSYLSDVAERAARSVNERLTELNELHRAGLITQEEFDRLVAAVMMSRDQIIP